MGIVRHGGHSAITSHAQACQGTLWHIEAYSSITEAYWAIFKHIQNVLQPLYIQLHHIQNPDTFRTWTIFKSLFNMLDDQACPEPYQNSLFNFFWRYLGTFRYIDAYSDTLTGTQLDGEGKAFPDVFWKVPWFWKKGPDCVHLWAKFSIQNIVYLGEQTPKYFPARTFFLWFWTNYLSAWNLPCPEKFQVLCLHYGIILFAKHSILNV